MGLVILVLMVLGVYIFGSLTSKREEYKIDNLGTLVLSFIVPLVGFIVGGINLTKDNKDDKDLGTKCIVLGLVSSVLIVILILS